MMPVTLFFATGPYCTKQCGHCYADCGPQHSDYLRSDIVLDAMQQARDIPDCKVVFSDGEPLHDLGNFLQMVHSTKHHSIGIETNAWFAQTYDDARTILEALKDVGFNTHPRFLPQTKKFVSSWIGTSADSWHGPDSYRTAINLAHAYLDTFDNHPPLDNFSIHYVASTFGSNPSGEQDFKEKLLKPLCESFDKPIPVLTGSMVLDTPKGQINLTTGHLGPFGRAGPDRKSIIHYSQVPCKNEDHKICIDHLGDVYCGHAQCKLPGKHLGNLDDGLTDLIEEFERSHFWQMDRKFGIGGIVRILHALTGHKEYYADSYCNICRNIFSNARLIYALKDYTSCCTMDEIQQIINTSNLD